MLALLFKKVCCYAILFSLLISGLLLYPGFLSSMEKSVLLDRVFRVNKTSPRTLFTYSDPENNDLDFEVYVVFDKRKGLIKIGFNPKIGMNINLIEKIIIPAPLLSLEKFRVELKSVPNADNMD